MKVTLESTTKVVEVDGKPTRVWEGRTDSGIAMHAFINLVAVKFSEDLSQFEAELFEHRPPRNPDIAAYPMRLAL